MLPINTDEPISHRTFITVLLILLNVGFFVIWQQDVGLERSVQIGGLVPVQMTTHASGAFERVWLAMFMHGSWMHLISNMWFLWIFGRNVEDLCGPIRFLCFYLSCGLVAAFAHIAFGPHSDIPMVGASGAIAGVLGGYLSQFPHSRVRMVVFFFGYAGLVHVRAFFFLIFWIGVQVISQFASKVPHDRGGVAYMAHVGGFVAGLLLIRVFLRPAPMPLRRAYS